MAHGIRHVVPGQKRTSNSKFSQNLIRRPKLARNRTPNSSAAADDRLGRRVRGARMQGGTCCWWRMQFGTWFRGESGRRILSFRKFQFEVLNWHGIGRRIPSAAADDRLGRRVRGARMQGGTCCWWRMQFGTWFRGESGRRILSFRKFQFEVLNWHGIGRRIPSAAADDRFGRRVRGARMQGGTCCWWRMEFGTWFRGKSGRRILSSRKILFDVPNWHEIGRRIPRRRQMTDLGGE